jgi:hypothetical protein
MQAERIVTCKVQLLSSLIPVVENMERCVGLHCMVDGLIATKAYVLIEVKRKTEQSVLCSQ